MKCFAPSAVGAVILLAATSGAATTHHIDCAAPAGGDGSLTLPYAALADVAALPLGPGDAIRLKRGTVCAGTLAPLAGSSGSAANPIVVGAYGDPADPLPRIDGPAATAGADSAAVQITDVSHVVVEDLELTNDGGVEPQKHRGVYLLASSGGVVENTTVRNLVIHDIEGDYRFCCGKGGGGIISSANNGSRFDGVLIENNHIYDIGRSGIFTTIGTGTRLSPGVPWPTAGTNYVARGNLVERVQGDGIVVLRSVDALVERNRVTYANLSGYDFLDFENRNCAAGIWTWASNHTVIQFNEVSHTNFGPSETNGCDGTGYNIDYNQEGTIVQFNYSYANEGGFTLLCTDVDPHSGVMRYNLSVDDHAIFGSAPCRAPDDIGDLSGVRMYNNTFVATQPRTSSESAPHPVNVWPGDFEFKNNIIAATEITAQPIGCGDFCSHNLFYNIPPSGTDFVIGDPQFVAPMFGVYGRIPAGIGFRLEATSPAIAAGIAIPDGTLDYFGNPVPSPPTIGFTEALPEPDQAPVLAAGLALLFCLSRLKRR